MSGARAIVDRLLAQSAWNAATARELESLSREKDSELFFEGLLHLAGREEKAGREPSALAIYQEGVDSLNRVILSASEGPPTTQGSIRSFAPLRMTLQRAQNRRDALLGHGAFGARAEALARRFLGEANAPSSLLAMAGAQAVFSLTRGALLFRLLASPESAFTRGFAARSLASLGGFALEAPAFVALGRGARLAGGHHGIAPSLGQELASSYLSLGLLKLSGNVAQAASSGWGQSPLVRGLFHDAAMVAGLMAAHGLESRLGIRPASGFDEALTDSLATLLQLKVGGRLLQSIGGPGYASRLRELDLRSQSAAFLPEFGFRPQPAAASAEFSVRPTREAPSNILLMEGSGGRAAASPRLGTAEAFYWRSPILDRLSRLEIPEDCDRIAVQIYDPNFLGVSSRAKIVEIELRIDEVFRRHPWLREAEVRLADGSKLMYYRNPQGYLKRSDPSSGQIGSPPARRSHELLLLGAWHISGDRRPLTEALGALRQALNLSQAEVAQRVSALTGEPKEADTIKRYEHSSEQAIPFPTLKALAEVYRVDLRDLIALANRSRFPEIPESAWITESYPIYLEEKSDLRRLDYFAKQDPQRQSLGWLVYSQRKNPFRYFYTRDFRNTVGMESGILDVEENRFYPSRQVMEGLARQIGLSTKQMVDAANRTFHPDLDMASLFPGQSFHLDPSSHDAALVRDYASSPGSLGQILFGYRKAQAQAIGAREMSQREGFAAHQWREIEMGFHEPSSRSWQSWYRYLKERKLSLEPIQPWLDRLNRFQENGEEAGRRLGRWKPRSTEQPLQYRLLELREAAGLGPTEVARLVTQMTGEKCTWNRIQEYEEKTPKMAFPILRALAEIYRVDVRDLVVDSNRGRFPGLDERLWLRSKPIYLESEADVERLRLLAEQDPRRRSLGWKIFAARKDPLRYQNLSDLASRTGISVKDLGRLETNQDYPTPKKIGRLSEALDLPEGQMLEAANRFFHPDFHWSRLAWARGLYFQPHSRDIEKLRIYVEQPGTIGQMLFEYRKGLPGHPSVEEVAKRLGSTEAWWNERELNQVGVNSRNRWRWEEVLDRAPELKSKIFGTPR